MNDTKEHILFTSLNLFMQKGFKEVTMKEIVGNSGLSKGAFYYYFSSKEQVFAELVNHFFTGIMVTDYALIPQKSLKEFYTGILNQYQKNDLETKKRIGGRAENTKNNYYYLIFDAMRMLPDFKKNHRQEQQKELEAWTRVIDTARECGEIETTLSNDQAAKLFIYLSDGVNINRVMNEQENQLENELMAIWDGLYHSLKK